MSQPQSGPGGWWQLAAIYDEATEYVRQWRSSPLPACPNDGEPLTDGPDGVRFCRFDGWRESDRRPTD